MFGDVWKWAGNFRQSDKNIGVDWRIIPVQLRSLLEDVKFWIDKETFPPDEIAARFHHRLVLIHLFPNGNGRHARLATDTLLEDFFHLPPFTWGNASLMRDGAERKLYIKALHSADDGDYSPLLQFVRL
jgi:Fic-DOC domain mobile mystery protein B